ncbi:hypothetical protein [Vibrio atypicus]|uniref:hypothetical protein n=1 Tax=Vibrio atypicus TaxID=558271 RepID=UPI001358BA10|nr:hypothetical protein [Vibrio atypicus]
MFPWSKNRIIKSVAMEIAPRLSIKFGKKEYYEPEEIDWALKALDKEHDIKYCNYAYAMITHHSFYMTLGLSSAFGAQPEFHREVSYILFKQDAQPTFDAYLEYAKINASTPYNSSNTSLDQSGGVDLGSDFSGGDSF